jgi:uncharacterized membrane protein
VAGLTDLRSWLTGKPISAVVYVVVFFFLVFIVPALVLSFSENTTTVSFRLFSSTESTGQIFYSENRAYSESNSQKFRVFEGSNSYQISLENADVSKLNFIRFDPVVKEATGVLSDFRVSNRISSVAVQDLAAAVTPLKSIELKGAAYGELAFYAEGSDPYFEIQIENSASLKRAPPEYFSAYLSLLGLLVFVGLALGRLRIHQIKAMCLRPEMIFIGAIFLCGLGLTVTIPPFQSPDEFKHFERANMIASGHLGIVRSEETVGGFVSPSLDRYMVHFGQLPHHPESRLSEPQVSQAKIVTWVDQSIFTKHHETSPYLPLIYMPQAIAVKLGQEANLSVHKTYLLARIFVLVVSLLLLVAAFNLIRPNALVLVILATPMMLFQLSSTTIDGATVGLGVLCVALFLSLRSDERFSPPKFWVLLPALLLLCGARPYLLPMYLLPLFLAITRGNRGLQVATIVAGFLSVGWVLFGTTQAVDERIVIGASRSEILIYYVSNPFEIMSLMGRTIDVFGLSYYQQFVGVLGWLDTHLLSTTYLVAASVFGLTLALVVIRSWSRSEVLNLSLLTLVALASVLLIFVALLLNWSEHPADIIQGVQGRYFTIPAVLVGYGLTAVSSDNVKMRISPLFIAFGWLAFSFVSTLSVLLARYYL